MEALLEWVECGARWAGGRCRLDPPTSHAQPSCQPAVGDGHQLQYRVIIPY